MNKTILALAVVIASTSILAAEPTAPAAAPAVAPPAMPTPGPETKIFDPLVGKITFDGVKKPMGTDVKDSMTMTCAKVAGGMYLSCTSTGAPPAPGMAPFDGAMIIGYDYLAKQYKGFMASMQSVGFALVGKLDGKKLVLENATDITVPSGAAAKTRMTYDFTNPKAIKMISERTDPKGAWFVFGEWTSK